MVSSCSAYGCTNRSSFARKIQFHRFPFRDPELLIRWVIAVRRQNWWPTQYSCICSDHFTNNDYKCKGKSLLNYDAVPSIFNFSPPKKKEKKYKRSTNQSPEKYKRKKFKPVNDASTADANSNSVSSEPVVIFLTDVHSDSANDVDTKNDTTKNYILNEYDMVDLMLNDTSHIPGASNDSVENMSVNQQIEKTASANNVTDSELNYEDHAFIPGANDSMRDISLPASPTVEQSMSAEDDEIDSDLNCVDDVSIPGTSDDLVTDAAVLMKQSTKRSHLKKDTTYWKSKSVRDVSISRDSNDTGRNISKPVTRSAAKAAVKNVSDSRLKSAYEVTDSNSSCDITDKVPLVINISGICSAPKSDISVSVKQLAGRIVATGKNATDMNRTDSTSATGLHTDSLTNIPKPQTLSAERGLKLNSSDASLPGNCNDSPSDIPLVITISGICISDLNAMSNVSVSVKQLTERTDSDKKSTFKLKSVHDRLISDICSDSMTDDSR